LEFDGTGSHSGPFTGAAGTELRFDGGGTFADTATITTAGRLALGGVGVLNALVQVDGSIQLFSGSWTLNDAITTHSFMEVVGGAHHLNHSLMTESVNISGGTLNVNGSQSWSTLALNGNLGGSGGLYILDSLTWTGGSMVGAGHTILEAAATATISGTSTRSLGRRLDNFGVIDCSGVGISLSGSGAELNNMPGAQFKVVGEVDFVTPAIVGQGNVNNAGSFTHSGTGTTTFRRNSASNWVFNNIGTVNVAQGNLEFDVAGTHSGPFTGATGTQLRFDGGGTFADTATITTGGNLTLAGIATLNGSLHVGDLTISSGATTINGTATFGSGQLASTLSGSGEITFTNSFTWSSGTMSGAGRTIIAHGATMSIPGTSHAISRRLSNYGTVIFNGTLVTSSSSATKIRNHVGGTFDVTATGDFTDTNGSSTGTAIFENAGTFKTVGQTTFSTRTSSTDTGEWLFNNSGTILGPAFTYNSTADITPPTSAVAPLASAPAGMVTINWSGSDAGAGVSYYGCTSPIISARIPSGCRRPKARQASSWRRMGIATTSIPSPRTMSAIARLPPSLKSRTQRCLWATPIPRRSLVRLRIRPPPKGRSSWCRSSPAILMARC
jgi:hypothetical protein